MEAHEATLNITVNGMNGDLPDPVAFDASDGDIKGWAAEAIRGGHVPGIAALLDVDFTDFVVERFPADEERPNRLMIRPKTPFGV